MVRHLLFVAWFLLGLLWAAILDLSFMRWAMG
jgi:hypothetical protein